GQFLDYDNTTHAGSRPLDPDIGQGLVSDFTQSGDFTFSARVQSLYTDDDIFGLVFGYQDPNNHYRLSWDGGGFEEADNHYGLHLIRELNGTATTLYWPSSPTGLKWAPDVAYDITVGRAGDTISINIDQ